MTNVRLHTLYQLCLQASAALATYTSTTVTGRVSCGLPGDRQVQVLLFEADGLFADDLLNRTECKSGTSFRLSGGQNDQWGPIEPYLVLQHTCVGMALKPGCYARARLDVPPEFVAETEGSPFHAGNIRLETLDTGNLVVCHRDAVRHIPIEDVADLLGDLRNL